MATGTKKKKKTKLDMETKWIWEKVTTKQRQEIMDLSEGYKSFLDRAKTERLAVEAIIEMVEAKGFVPLEKVESPEQGTRFYMVNRGKCIALVILGKGSIENGANIIASHLDAPRLDPWTHPVSTSRGSPSTRTARPSSRS